MMTNLQKILEEAVFKGLSLSPDLTIHSILRYAERFCKENLNFKKAEYRAKFGHQISDTKLYWNLYRENPTLIERIKDDLEYFTVGKVQTFEEDGIKFIIKDFKLITIFIKH